MIQLWQRHFWEKWEIFRKSAVEVSVFHNFSGKECHLADITCPVDSYQKIAKIRNCNWGRYETLCFKTISIEVCQFPLFQAGKIIAVKQRIDFQIIVQCGIYKSVERCRFLCFCLDGWQTWTGGTVYQIWSWRHNQQLRRKIKSPVKLNFLRVFSLEVLPRWKYSGRFALHEPAHCQRIGNSGQQIYQNFKKRSWKNAQGILKYSLTKNVCSELPRRAPYRAGIRNEK